METILNPEFIIRKQDAFILEHFDIFAKLCDQLKNKDSSVEMFKTLSEVPVFTVLLEIDRLFSMLKKAIFAKQAMLLSHDYDGRKSNTSIESTNVSYKFLPCEFDRASLVPVYKELQNTILQHIDACLKLQEAQKVMSDMYKRVYDNTPDVKGTHVYEAFRKLNMAKKEEQTIRETILSLSDKLTNVARAFVLNRVMRGVNALERFCQTENLSKKLLDELRSCDVHQMTTEIVEQCSVKYCFPNLEKNPMDTQVPYNTYPAVSGDKQCNNNNGLNAHNANEMVHKYIIAMKNVKAKYSGQLSLKKGKEVKQKMVSEDGKVAFGWTRLFKGAPKSYGFYLVNTTTS